MSDIKDLDEVIHVLGVEDSEVTPADRAREWLAEIEALRAKVKAKDAEITELHIRWTKAQSRNKAVPLRQRRSKNQGN